MKETKWVSIEERLPPLDNKYLVCCESADSDKPLIAIAWYDPKGFGWSLLPQMWINSISHWMDVPDPPMAGLRRFSRS